MCKAPEAFSDTKVKPNLQNNFHRPSPRDNYTLDDLRTMTTRNCQRNHSQWGRVVRGKEKEKWASQGTDHGMLRTQKIILVRTTEVIKQRIEHIDLQKEWIDIKHQI